MAEQQLDEKTQRELQQFVAVEQQKARFQQQVHNFTDTCWDKCIGKVGSSLSSSEQTCLSQCVERFLDTSMFMVKRLEQMSHQ